MGHEVKTLGRIDFDTDSELTVAHALVQYIQSAQFTDRGVYNVRAALMAFAEARRRAAEPELNARLSKAIGLLRNVEAKISEFLRREDDGSN